jgi:hypothetical protein
MPDTEARLEKIERKIDMIAETLQTVAVQSERITNLQTQITVHQGMIDDLYRKHDVLIEPNGVISVVRNHQASCPRGQIKYLWAVVVPLSLSLLAVAYDVVFRG